MLDGFKRIFGLGGSMLPDELLLEKNKIIVDVRSQSEFNAGHIKGSINIPVGAIEHNIGKLKGKSPIILCCASGARSGMATSILKGKGFKEVYNAGGWAGLNEQLQSLKEK
ncbi:MAG TPA: rhodanese-like domain-containing protein [Bacteroidia bacterium]|nr:rhodanese-like domain-containing protein [Bacteroidia bacterium]